MPVTTSSDIRWMREQAAQHHRASYSLQMRDDAYSAGLGPTIRHHERTRDFFIARLAEAGKEVSHNELLRNMF